MLAFSFAGLTLTLFIDRDEYVNYVTSATGARVLIHKRGHHPFLAENGFDAEVGMRTAVKLKQV